jgi:predicted alpha/beta superfamily hydrolase
MLRSAVAIIFLATLDGMSQHEFEKHIPSRHLGTNRTVRVRLPDSYWREPARRYPVLYLHDGQNIFASAGTNCCFGWGSWEVDKTAARLAAEGRMREVILVGVDNSRFRYPEYRGPTTATGETGRERSHYENYGNFLTKELKPLIDQEYRTLKSPRDTAILGSSMGGICSLALAWEHPRTFGALASLSGAFQVEKRYFLENVLKSYKGRLKPLRIYLDSGMIDFTGDDDGRRHTTAVAAELRRIGWKDGRNLSHFVDEHIYTPAELQKLGLPKHKWKEAQASQHNEFYWRERVWRALEFLFPPEP